MLFPKNSYTILLFKILTQLHTISSTNINCIEDMCLQNLIKGQISVDLHICHLPIIVRNTIAPSAPTNRSPNMTKRNLQRTETLPTKNTGIITISWTLKYHLKEVQKDYKMIYLYSVLPRFHTSSDDALTPKSDTRLSATCPLDYIVFHWNLYQSS